MKSFLKYSALVALGLLLVVATRGEAVKLRGNMSMGGEMLLIFAPVTIDTIIFALKDISKAGE